eukprot:7983244-Alexandrium_andersonii.AAC.1
MSPRPWSEFVVFRHIVWRPNNGVCSGVATLCTRVYKAKLRSCLRANFLGREFRLSLIHISEPTRLALI